MDYHRKLFITDKIITNQHYGVLESALVNMTRSVCLRAIACKVERELPRQKFNFTAQGKPWTDYRSFTG